MRIHAIIPSRQESSQSPTRTALVRYFEELSTDRDSGYAHVIYDASSIYSAVKTGLEQAEQAFNGHPLKDDDIIVICHDDIEILNSYDTFLYWIKACLKNNTGFIGVAGASYFGPDGVWWNARMTGAARGFVFQGISHQRMTPNYFGLAGQVVALDGCFLAASYKTIKTLGFNQPHYISTGWDFYDICATFNAHTAGFNNYAVPILIRHESIGQMREGWYKAKEQFLKFNARDIPCKLNMEKTHGIPGM